MHYPEQTTRLTTLITSPDGALVGEVPTLNAKIINLARRIIVRANTLRSKRTPPFIVGHCEELVVFVPESTLRLI